MMDENLNPWDVDHKIRAYDYVRKEWRDFSLMELSEEDWRKWVCWKLEQLQKETNKK